MRFYAKKEKRGKESLMELLQTARLDEGLQACRNKQTKVSWDRERKIYPRKLQKKMHFHLSQKELANEKREE